MEPTQIGNKMTDKFNNNPDYDQGHADGYQDAIDHVLDIINDMQYTYDWHNPTLDELEQRIV